MTKRQATLSYGVIAALLLMLYYPALVWLAKSWAIDPYYTHGFLIPIVSALLAWRQWRYVRSEPPVSNLSVRHFSESPLSENGAPVGRLSLTRLSGLSWSGLFLIASSLGVAAWAMRWQNHVVVSFTLVSMLGGILLFLEGWLRVKRWLFPLLFLCFMIPLPFIDLASPWLEAFAAKSATTLARAVGIAAAHQGGEITLPSLTLVVGAPCSGLRSLVAMVTLSVGWVYIVEGRLVSKAALLIAIVPLVLLSNVLRIFALLVVAVTLGETAALTYYHDWSSPILFLVSLALLLILGKVLGCSKVREDIF